MLFGLKIFEDGHGPSPGLFAVPYLELPELSLIFCVKPMENFSPLSPAPDWLKAHYAEMRKSC
jgi:hypothetical protein